MDFKTDEFGYRRADIRLAGTDLLFVDGAGIAPVPAHTAARLIADPAAYQLLGMTISGRRVVSDAGQHFSVSVWPLEQLAVLHAQIDDLVSVLPVEARALWAHTIDQHLVMARRSREAAGDWMKP